MKSFRIFSFLLGIVFASGFTVSFAQREILSPYQRLLETREDYLKALKTGDTLEIAEMCYRMGKRYIGINNLAEAEQWLLRSARMREPYQPHLDLGKVYARLAECELYMGNIRKQFDYLVIAERHHRLDGSELGRMLAYRCAASLHDIALGITGQLPEQKEFKASADSSEKYHRASLAIAKKRKLYVDQALTHQFIGNLAFHKGQMQQGIAEYQRSFAIYRSDQRDANLIAARVELAKVLLNHKLLSLAKIQMDSASALARTLTQMPTVGQLASLDLELSRYYQAKQNWKAAFFHQQKYDSLTLLERDHYRETALAGMNALHDNETKELKMALSSKELAMAKQTQADQQTLLRVLLGITCAALLAGVLFHRLYKKYQALSEQNSALVKEQSHRIKNNLQSVSDLMGLRLLKLTDPLAISMIEESLSRVETIALIHRRLYTHEHLDAIELDAFINELVEEILTSRELPNVRLDINVDQILLFVDQAIPLGLIVHELITNACKYAFPVTREPSLRIDIDVADGYLQVDLADNGPGFKPKLPYETFGMQVIGLLAKNLKAQTAFIPVTRGSHFSMKFAISHRSRYAQSHGPKLTTDVLD
nr:sensor histidine kinase [uncultured Dyadobacter sp.]